MQAAERFGADERGASEKRCDISSARLARILRDAAAQSWGISTCPNWRVPVAS